MAGAALALLGAATPLIAHAVGGACWIYLPAHLPALLAGLAFGPVAGFATGALTALADLLWGGRVEGIAFLPIGLELVTYGLVAGLAAARADRYGSLLVALIVAMLAGRLAYLAAALALARPTAQVVQGLFVRPWPGILLQLAALPPAAVLLRRHAR